MSDLGLVAGLALAVLGLLVVVLGAPARRRDLSDLTDVFDYVDLPDAVDEYQARLSRPFYSRVVGGLVGGLGRPIVHFLPGHYLASTQRRLNQAGMGTSRSASEQVLSQMLLGVVLFVVGMVLGLAAGWVAPNVLAVAVLLGAMGFMWPSVRLARQVRQRSEAILDDLPDTLDLLAISVEAGLGFEGAVEVVREHFVSALADEFTLMLGEMQLGLSRREALENMRNRTDVAALSTFIQAMIQADALGMPVGRVLKTQAMEMRSQRRQWAREKAAKLPVKILLPLVLFIFPPIMIVVLGPAVLSFRNFG